MLALRRFSQLLQLRRVGYDYAAHRVAMACQILGQAVHHDIGTKILRPAKVGSGERIVDNEWDASLLRDLSNRRKIDDNAAGIFARHVLDEVRVFQRRRAHHHAGNAEIEPAIDRNRRADAAAELDVAGEHLEDRLHVARLAEHEGHVLRSEQLGRAITGAPRGNVIGNAGKDKQIIVHFGQVNRVARHI